MLSVKIMGVGLGQSYTMSKPTLSFILKPRDFEWLASLLPDWGRITTRPESPTGFDRASFFGIRCARKLIRPDRPA